MRNRNLSLFLINLILICIQPIYAQSDSTGTGEPEKPAKKDKKVMIAPLPAIGTSPSTGFLIGATASVATFLGPKETTHMSNAGIGFVFTQKKQFFITLKSTVFTKNDSWCLQGDWRYMKQILPNYGLGTGPNSSKIASTGFEYSDNMWSKPIDDNQMIGYNHLRLHEVAMKRMNESHFYVGIGYRLDVHNKISDKLLNLTDSIPTITSHYAYSQKYGFDDKKYVLSSISIDAIYDTRDNVANPYSGRYANISFRMSPTFLGSSKNATNLWVEYRDYLSLSKKNPRHMFAFWAFGHFQTSGKHGYLDLPASGFDQYGRSARPYTQGRFKGQEFAYTEVEYRFPIYWSWLGGVVYGNISTVSNKDANINLYKYVEPGYGAGLRFMLNKKSRVNLGLEYAFGAYGAQGIIMSLTEAF